ncbi:MAG: hypothetical protein HC854_08730 [Flavobacterium sp.]|nr:hypothetical protein [Flavobacterium sp.]
MKIVKTIAKKGHYKNRMQIAENLYILKDAERTQLVEILIYDPIEFIFEKAIVASETLLLKKDLKSKIEERKKYWLHRKIAEEKQNKITTENLKGTSNFKRKFGSGESLNNVKEMLKKPMNTGKWF